MVGSPPPARGPPNPRRTHATSYRITPACAGTTCRCTATGWHPSDHPRLRGDHWEQLAATVTSSGSPPPARGPLVTDPARLTRRGITPACAGTTCRTLRRGIRWPDHPRLRGDHIRYPTKSAACLGSPPPARGPLVGLFDALLSLRITPAYAGTTPPTDPPPPDAPDHPRLRGDHPYTFGVGAIVDGSPPPARNPLPDHALPQTQLRITPACAGTTWRSRSRTGAPSDHPRLRGDHTNCPRIFSTYSGSPPPARGPPACPPRRQPTGRITPACAGTTPPPERSGGASSDHPRLRGDHPHAPIEHGAQYGSPPPARGPRLRIWVRPLVLRITSACAGTTLRRRRDRGRGGGSPPPARGPPP